MSQICAKVYYEILTGTILIITSELQGDIEKTIKEQDMEIYEQLKDKNTDEVDFIELPYGTLASTFNNIKSYSINLETKTFSPVYYTQEELDTANQKNQEAQALTDKTSTIAEYVQLQDASTITDLESAILTIETNKILNGGM